MKYVKITSNSASNVGVNHSCSNLLVLASLCVALDFGKWLRISENASRLVVESTLLVGTSASPCPASPGMSQVTLLGKQSTTVTKGTTCLLCRALSARAALQASITPPHRLLRHAQAHQQVIISYHQWHASHVQQASSRTGLLSARAVTALPASSVLSKGPAAVAALELAPQGLTAPLEGVQQQHR